MAEHDPLLARLERTSAVFCAAAATVGLAFGPDRLGLAAGILGGGILVGISYWAIKSSVDGLLAIASRLGATSADPTGDPEQHRSGGTGHAGTRHLLRLTGRYALLGLIAYVMIARLRLHPIGLLVGASSAVVAATIEAIRILAHSGRSARR